MPGNRDKHRKWMTILPPDTAGMQEIWDKEERMRRFRMQQREDAKLQKDTAEALSKAPHQAHVRAMNKAARRARREMQAQRRSELLFAKGLELERLETREQAGDRWVEKRMCHTAELEKVATQIKLQRSESRLEAMKKKWHTMEDETLSRKSQNRAMQLERLRPLTALGTDVASLIVDHVPSPMLQRMAAIADIHQSSAHQQRSSLHSALCSAKRKQRLNDLGATRQTAENRAEQTWLVHLEQKGLASHGC